LGTALVFEAKLRHQDERVDAPTRALACLRQGGQELFPIRVIAKNRFLPIATIQQMINRAGELDSRFARHDLILGRTTPSSRANLPRF
jgi:hypothetical protein